jgi:hypothetical protein
VKKFGHTTRGNKNWNMPRKFEMKKFENFHFLAFEMKIYFWNLKKNWPYHQREMKRLKCRNHIFCLCHWDKTSNNTSIPPMYTTLYHYWKTTSIKGSDGWEKYPNILRKFESPLSPYIRRKISVSFKTPSRSTKERSWYSFSRDHILH